MGPNLREASAYEIRAVEIVRSVLTPDLLPPDVREPHPMGGFCYWASEALYYILGGAEAGFVAKRAMCENGEHWWLEGRSDKLIDSTADQFEDAFPYSEGIVTDFYTREPSPRAVTIMLRAGATGLVPG